jgi:hydrogenase maturation protease
LSLILPEGPAGKPAILVFGYGNPSRGDDALGPMLVERLEPWLVSEPQSAGRVECLTDFQLQIEHALDLVGRKRVLFVDAHIHCPAPWQLSVLQPAVDASYSTHAISPASVLRVYQQIHEADPPPSFLLGIRGKRFELGEPLTDAAESHLASALECVKSLCLTPTADHWRACCR